MFLYCSKAKTAEIPNSVKTLEEACFSECRDLNNVVIPSSVTTLPRDLFDDCFGLENVYIPDSVTTIEPYAFRQCTSLKSVTLPKSVKSLEDNTFYRCMDIETVIFEGDIEKIGADAFYDSEKIKEVYFEGKLPTQMPEKNVYNYNTHQNETVCAFYESADVIKIYYSAEDNSYDGLKWKGYDCTAVGSIAKKLSAERLLKHISGIKALDPITLNNSDISGDNAVDILDVITILNQKKTEE